MVTRDYVCVDIETTGVRSKEDRIIEIGAVKLNEKLNIVSSFNRYIKPQVYTTLHNVIKDLVSIDQNKFNNADTFSVVFEKFMEWCGEDYIFCTWGVTDLYELQRNMNYYDIENRFVKPLIYYDIQKFYSILYQDGKRRSTLETVVKELGIPTRADFHNALNDAHYTALICKKIDFYRAKNRFSIDHYCIPCSREEEIYATYDTYEKFISMGYDSKEELIKDKVIFTDKCYICNKRMKKDLDWFSNSNHVYYFLGMCSEHGMVKGRVHIKKTEDNKYFAVRILKVTDEEGAGKVILKQQDILNRHKEKKISK